MDGQLLFNIAASAVLGALGWFGRVIYEEIRALSREVAEHKKEVAEDYSSKEDHRDLKTEITGKLDYLINRVDRLGK